MRPLICRALTALLLLVVVAGCEKTIRDVRSPASDATLASR
jgi:hypothetical protein